MTPIDVISSTCIDFNKENNNEDPELYVYYHVRIKNMKIFLQKETLFHGSL